MKIRKGFSKCKYQTNFHNALTRVIQFVCTHRCSYKTTSFEKEQSIANYHHTIIKYHHNIIKYHHNIMNYLHNIKLTTYNSDGVPNIFAVLWVGFF